MSDTLFDVKYEMAKDRDKLEHALGDALDAKGAFFLVAIALFVTILMPLSSVAPPIATWAWLSLLIGTIGTLVAGTAYLFAAVWSRTYLLPFVPSRYEPWIESELEKRLKRGVTNNDAREEILELHRQHLMKFIDNNHAINKTKSTLIESATRFFAASSVGVLACLVLLTLRVLF